MKLSRAGIYLSVILAMVFWGFTFVAFKYANAYFRPISIVFIRLFVSIFFLFGFALLFKRLGQIRREDQKWFLLMALFEPFFYFLGESFGLTLVTATVGAVIISTIPLFVPFASYLLYRERLTLLNRIGLVISFGGVLMVILAKTGGLSADPKGILLMLVAVFSAVGYTMLVKKLADDYNPITITAYQSFYGLLMFLPLFLIFEMPLPDFRTVSMSSLFSLLYLGVFGSGICFILLTIGIRELGAAKANVFGNIIPVVTAIVSFFLLKEAMPFIKIVGIFVVIAGLLMSQVSRLGDKKSIKNGIFQHPPYS